MQQVDGFHFEALPADTKHALETFSKMPLFRGGGWYLAGGTALALQVGHRQSVDLDFFTPEAEFDRLALEGVLLKTGDWNTTSATAGTLYGEYAGAKASFIAYPFFVASGTFTRFGTVKILPPEDIAVMKIIAISQRCRKRDFVDLYWYVKNREPLCDILSRVQEHYPTKNLNFPHFIKSLTYFTEAEDDPMPTLFFKATWGEIKAYFRREVPAIAKNILGLK
ncbi:MAG: nucleotidyl transferase AbiEii/AbiGii toxin family protein [Candidatus Liptonbacteria bacterium]|nr:nucleotidyl transferase AbiEii/AbiGii toxin family protein [Candidatus Liptonbacteria bacterium]